MSAAAPTPAEAAFRRFGHLEAALDPLGLRERVAREEIGEASGGLTEEESGRLRQVYAGYLGTEFEHLESAAERAWWAAALEDRMPGFALSPAQSRNAAVQMLSADIFENFLGKKYVSLKRYSGEGCEALLPALDTVFAAAGAGGVKDVVIGMAHRGRLAVLVSLLGYQARKLFWKIGGNEDFPAAVQGVDDVTSHISASIDKVYGSGERAAKVHVTLLHNPSHLEAVNPVAAGKARAKADQGSANALCVMVHGDAAVYGQGVVAECYAMSRLPAYTTGGSVHIVTNNQVGFTADDTVSRSSRYASDLAKVVGAPVLHVNAEQLREVVLACTLAVEYRNAFHKDVVIDLIGYRRFGHNELDEPAFTQPAMYRAIRGRAPFATAYADSLVAGGGWTAAQRDGVAAKLAAHLEAEFQAAKAYTAASGANGPGDGAAGSGRHVVADGSAFGGKWCGMRQAAPEELLTSPDTGVPADVLVAAGKASVALPPDFTMHDRLLRGHVTPRLEALAAGPAAPVIDWATAEALAFGSLLAAGHDVRMTGQDAQRGTFSHRHAALTHQASGAKHVPLNSVAAAGRGKLHIYSSLLSEFAVSGFEYGYSWESPRPLVLWEAQFGDFANGAQIIIDQFLSGGESKWLRQSGMVMLLPHGFDGAGPEHSSARIERFLQLVNSQAVARGAAAVDPAAMAAAGYTDKTAAEGVNMLVANPTTPANYFHLLRRQIVRPFRKPLVVIAPKALLRHPAALSSLNDMAPGTAFQPVLMEGAGASVPAPADVKRVILTSGKFHLELAAERAAGTPAAIVRVEELAPFPTAAVMAAVARYPAATDVVWAQEEPANAGAWTWAEAHLAGALASAGLPPLRYVGRPALPAPAVGLSKRNKAQQAFVLSQAFAGLK